MASRTSQKLSFASVAAMAPPAPVGRTPAVSDDKTVKSAKNPSRATTKVATSRSSASSPPESELQTSMSRLEIKSSTPIISEQENGAVLRSRVKLDDEKTYLSSSSTKPASLDGKSVASGATFAMDEKESLRPDDSASVKAGDEEDFYSGPASGAPSSRVGSEAGGKAFRDQFNEISERMGPGDPRGTPLGRRVIPGIAEESSQGTIAAIISVVPAPTSIPRPDMVPTSGGPFVYNLSQEPDDKLIEALESPKDRLFLLQLEQQVISFIKDSQEPILDLPPCNSFCRLLAHRLGDYYALTHFVDNAVSAVRLYRTPYCRLPTPLSVFAKPPASTDGVISNQPSVRIMRRAGLKADGNPIGSGGNTTSSSMVPSKAGSETGDESQRGTGMVSPTESTTAKDKSSMTREEREAKYKETRDRIFKGFEDTENPEATAGTETSNEVSRASSTTGKKKNKKTNNKQSDDGFQARSQFEAFYPTGQYSAAAYDQSAMASTMFFNPYLPQPNSQPMHPGMTQTYNSSFQPLQPSAYQTQMQNAPMLGGPSPYPPNNVTPNFMPFGQQMAGQFYPAMQQPNQMAPPSSNLSSPALSSNSQLSRSQSQISEQHWSGNGYTNPYQMFANPQAVFQQPNPPQLQANTPLGGVPYQYGQLPYQAGAQNGRSQHPVPGSYNRQAFNPQTRSFVPTNGFVPQPLPYGGQPTTNPSGFNQRPNFQPGVSFGQQQILQQQMPPIPQPGQLHMTHPLPSYTRKSSGQTPGSQSPGQNTLSKWGTPANLPPKPPPPEGSSTSNPPTIQNMAAGQGIPTFQNGTYSKPSDSS